MIVLCLMFVNACWRSLLVIFYEVSEMESVHADFVMA